MCENDLIIISLDIIECVRNMVISNSREKKNSFYVLSNLYARDGLVLFDFYEKVLS